MHMDVLRCKSPALVRREVWNHILAYNLIRTIMAQAAIKHGLEPRTISFEGAFRLLEEFQRLLDYQTGRGAAHRRRCYAMLLDCIPARNRMAARLSGTAHRLQFTSNQTRRARTPS